MKLLTKLTLLALAVSALPVALAGYFSLRIGQRALRGCPHVRQTGQLTGCRSESSISTF